MLQRIAKGKFSLDGADYTLATNNGPNALHGGVKGFDKRVWGVLRTKVTADQASVTFGLTAVDGEEGYPGTLHAESEFVLSAANEMSFVYRATVEGKATPINMCKWVHLPCLMLAHTPPQTDLIPSQTENTSLTYRFSVQPRLLQPVR